MPSPQHRSRSVRRVYVKLPSSRSTIHYEKRKNGSAVCAICKKPLRGVKNNNGGKLSKSEKRPERIYGGYICHKCLEYLVKQTTRGIS